MSPLFQNSLKTTTFERNVSCRIAFKRLLTESQTWCAVARVARWSHPTRTEFVVEKISEKKNFVRTFARKCKNKAFPSTQCEVRPGKTTYFGISEKISTAARLTAKKKRLNSDPHFASRSWPSTFCFCESRRCSTLRFLNPSSQAPWRSLAYFR